MSDGAEATRTLRLFQRLTAETGKARLPTVRWGCKRHKSLSWSEVDWIGVSVFRTDFTDLNLYCIKGALALVVLVSFSGYVC